MLFLASFEADATEALAHMHSMGVVHCDHKLANILICRSDAPGGFVGKVTDPGVWCGESRIGKGTTEFQEGKNHPKIPLNYDPSLFSTNAVHPRLEDTPLEFTVDFCSAKKVHCRSTGYSALGGDSC